MLDYVFLLDNNIAFVDSDDWLSKDACEKAFDIFTHYPLTDTVLFQVKNVYGDKDVDSLCLLLPP